MLNVVKLFVWTDRRWKRRRNSRKSRKITNRLREEDFPNSEGNRSERWIERSNKTASRTKPRFVKKRKTIGEFKFFVFSEQKFEDRNKIRELEMKIGELQTRLNQRESDLAQIKQNEEKRLNFLRTAMKDFVTRPDANSNWRKETFSCGKIFSFCLFLPSIDLIKNEKEKSFVAEATDRKKKRFFLDSPSFDLKTNKFRSISFQRCRSQTSRVKIKWRERRFDSIRTKQKLLKRNFRKILDKM